MTNILLYSPPIYKCSGGLCNFKLFFDICKQLKYKIYFCPLLKNIDSLNFISEFNDKSINSITHKELVAYYNVQDCDTILEEDIVTPQILQSRNNVIIYAEDVIGNPAEQKHIVRWLHFFPIENAVINYDFENDLIYFFSDFIYNFYEHLCNNTGITNNLTKNIKELNICRVFKFDKNNYKNLNINRINKNIMYKNKTFTSRKFFPPASFNNCNIIKNINSELFENIKKYHKNNILKIKKDIFKKDILKIKNVNEVNELNKVIKQGINYDTVCNYWKEMFLSNGYEEIGWKSSPTEFVEHFKTKSLFVTLDPFTFITIIAALTGCISVVKKIDGLDFNEWQKGDPFNKFGIAYGMDTIDHALRTKHLLLNHIQNMYMQNDNNVLNMINKIETKFSISIKN